MAKNKVKTHKGLSKRVKLTASGKVRRHRAGKGHLLSGKSATRKQQLGKATLINKTNERTAKIMLGKG